MNMQRDENGQLVMPKFAADLPHFLLAKCTPAERWQCEQQSIARQQNDWLISMAMNADERLLLQERELGKLKKLRWILSGKWSLITALLTSLLIPGALTFLLVWLEHHWNAKP